MLGTGRGGGRLTWRLYASFVLHLHINKYVLKQEWPEMDDFWKKKNFVVKKKYFEKKMHY